MVLLVLVIFFPNLCCWLPKLNFQLVFFVEEKEKYEGFGCCAAISSSDFGTVSSITGAVAFGTGFAAGSCHFSGDAAAAGSSCGSDRLPSSNLFVVFVFDLMKVENIAKHPEVVGLVFSFGMLGSGGESSTSVEFLKDGSVSIVDADDNGPGYGFGRPGSAMETLEGSSFGDGSGNKMEFRPEFRHPRYPIMLFLISKAPINVGQGRASSKMTKFKMMKS